MLNDREAFKAGFLKRCADEGLSREETISLAKQANEQVTKQAYGPLLDAIKGVAGTAYGVGLPIAAFGPAALGVGGAYAYAKATDSDDTDVESVRKQELAELYRSHAKKIRESRRRYASS